MSPMEPEIPKGGHKLELFISENCLSLQPAMQLFAGLQKEFPDLAFEWVDHPKNMARAKKAGVFIIPSFVLDAQIISVGLPSKKEITLKLREALNH